jgi:hypothetical protein
MTLLQLGGDVLLRITRIVKQDNFSKSLSNCQIVQSSFRKVGLKAIAVNFSTPGENTHAVGCCFQGNKFELIGPADRPAYLDNSPRQVFVGPRSSQLISACATGNACIGFLDTFDLFDSSRAPLPENFLQLALLSFVSVLVCDLRLQKSAIA